MAIQSLGSPAQTPEEYRELLRFLGRVRFRAKAVILLQGVLTALLLPLAAIPVCFVLDNVLHLPNLPRLVLAALTLVGFGAILYNKLRPLFDNWSHERLAVRVEGAFPEIDNHLINAIQLGVKSMSVGPFVSAELLRQALEQSRRARISRTAPVRSLNRLLMVLAGLLLLIAVYRVALPNYFLNAINRYFSFGAAPPPLTRTMLTVRPGDVTVGLGETVQVVADIDPTGTIPKEARLELRGADDRPGKALMIFSGSRFIHEFRDLRFSCEYRALSNDFKSKWYKITVVEKPHVAAFELTMSYPAYTGLAPQTVEQASGHLQALEGTRVQLTAIANKVVGSASFRFTDGKQRPPRKEDVAVERKDGTRVTVSRLTVELEVIADVEYQVSLKDSGGFDNQPSPRYMIRAVKDSAPRIVILSPSSPVEAVEGGALTVMYRASDDYGVGEVRGTLFAGDAKQGRVAHQRELRQAQTRLEDGFELDLSGHRAGEELRLRLTAFDNNKHARTRGLGESDDLIIRIIGKDVEARDITPLMSSLIDQLHKIIKLQKQARDDVRGRLDKAADEPAARETSQRVFEAQVLIRKMTQEAAGGIESSVESLSRFRETLKALSETEMTQAVEVLAPVQKQAEAVALQQALRGVEPVQTRILSILFELLKRIRRDFPALEEEVAQELVEQEEHSSEDITKKLQKLHERLKEFQEVQAKVIETSEELAQKKPEDMTPDDLKKIDDLIMTEDEWARYLKNDHADLSRLPMTTSDTALLNELVEIYSEIKKVADELQPGNIELMIPAEETGLELATTMTANLEKWLEDTSDHVKWNMEDPAGAIDVPICDLPEELEDLMGELLNSEEDMTEEVDDESSAWADSLDKGAGWGVADGPISNYSAQGKTGNTMPNKSEIGGRSGEGRSGRSHGEFVEKTAIGKGGRTTPTRLADEDFEKGEVEDTSRDPVGGATGGGKISGMGAEGLAGGKPPPPHGKLLRLKGQQANIKSKAQELEQVLMKYKLPTHHLSEARYLMDQASEALNDGRYKSLSSTHEKILRNLKSNDHMVREKIRFNYEQQSGVKNQVRQNITQGLQEEFPEGYEELIQAYYEKISGRSR